MGNASVKRAPVKPTAAREDLSRIQRNQRHQQAAVARRFHALSRQRKQQGEAPGALGASPDGLSSNPETLGFNPEALSSDPETLSFNPETLSFDSETLSSDPETLSFNPDALSFDPETLNFYADGRKISYK